MERRTLARHLREISVEIPEHAHQTFSHQDDGVENRGLSGSQCGAPNPRPAAPRGRGKGSFGSRSRRRAPQRLPSGGRCGDHMCGQGEQFQNALSPIPRCSCSAPTPRLYLSSKELCPPAGGGLRMTSARVKAGATLRLGGGADRRCGRSKQRPYKLRRCGQPAPSITLRASAAGAPTRAVLRQAN